jgi:hypothetical protein
MSLSSIRIALSLLACGLIAGLIAVSAIAWASGPVSFPQQPAGSAAPEVEVVSAKWVLNIIKPRAATGPAMSSETIEKSERVNDPIPVVIPNPKDLSKPIERRFYVYSAEILNRGQKVIKALKWSYVFSDRVTHEELKRHGAFSEATIRPSEKKTLQFRTPLSPPRVVNANSPNAASPFAERVVIECLLFADGSLWANPQAKAGLCDNLRGNKR